MSIYKQYIIGDYRFYLSADASGYTVDREYWINIIKKSIPSFDTQGIPLLKIRQVASNTYVTLNLYWSDNKRKGFPSIDKFETYLKSYPRKIKLSKIR